MLDPGQRQRHQPHEDHQDTEYLGTNEGFAGLILRHQVLENLVDRESETDQGRTGANPRHQRSFKSEPGAFGGESRGCVQWPIRHDPSSRVPNLERPKP